MGKPLSMDLRARALAAVDGGLSRRAAARRFGVSGSSVIRWGEARRATGSSGEDERSARDGQLRGKAWGRIASLIETAKINGVEPFAYLKARLEAIAQGHPKNRLEDLLPWNFASASS